jgi:sortase A
MEKTAKASKKHKIKGKPKRIFGTVMISFGVMAMVIALGISAYSIYIDHRGEESSSRVLGFMEAQIPDLDDEENGDVADIRALYDRYPDMDMQTMTVDGNNYIGVLEIPDIDLELPIMSSWSDTGLNISPCRYVGSIYSNNMVIAGHNYQSHFGRLKELEIGAEVKFTDVDGNVFTYKVAESDIIQPTAIDEMVDNVWDLSLFTCTYGGRTRYTVRCELDEEDDEYIQAGAK